MRPGAMNWRGPRMPDLPPPEIITAIRQAAGSRARILVAIAGPPGAGKSTVAEALAGALEQAAVLPMDGFHLDNETLTKRGLLHRKGAPETFDTDGLFEVLQQVQQGGAVAVPTFDRTADRVVPEGGMIAADTRIVLVEGNYLLLDAPGWARLHRFWDVTIAIQVELSELERRLTARWLDHGYSPAQAQEKVAGNDLLNAKLVLSRSVPADMIFDQTAA